MLIICDNKFSHLNVVEKYKNKNVSAIKVF